MRGPVSRVGLLLAGLLHLSCNQAILTAPTGSTITLIANPPFITANGDVAVVSAILIEPIGTPVADGTVVQFFTTLGTIEEQGKTNDGVARVNLISDARSGTATIGAVSGGATAEVSVEIGNVRPKAIFVTAWPTRLIDRRAARIVATVVDDVGNPLANIPVVFTVSGPLFPNPASVPGGETTGEYMESRGSPVFTDNNGQAIDVMRTPYPFGAPVREVRVTATVLIASAVFGSVLVTIN